MKQFFLIVLAATSAFAADWPTSVATDADLLRASDNASSTLSAVIDQNTLTLPVASSARFIANSVVVVGSEQVKICSVGSGVLTACSGGRGVYGTSAVPHGINTSVKNLIVSAYHNLVESELIAVEGSMAKNKRFITDFGAAGNGTTNDTSTFQAALDSGFPVIDGGGKTYAISNVQVPSNIVIQNVNISVIPGSSFPITGLNINGVSSPKSNITIKDVKINGNRSQMSSFDVNTGNDGDKSCIKMSGNTSNVMIEHLTANYCGTDGLQLLSHSPASDNDSDLQFHDITVRDSTFKFNRRQGISADSTVNFLVSNVVAEYNGLDMAIIQSLTGTNSNADLTDWQSGSYTATSTCGASFAASVLHGDCGGRTLAGSPYASGIDIEGYGVGSANHNLSILVSKLLYNAKGGLLATDQANPATTGFVIRRGYHIIGNTLDVGYYNGSLGPFPWALYVTAGFPGEYQDIEIAGNIITSGVLGIFQISNGGVVVGNRINTNGLAAYWMNTGTSTDLRISGNSSDQATISYFDMLGSIAQELFPRTAANDTLSAASNYTALFGSFNTPLGIGSFSDKDVISSFGTPLYINPNGQITVFPSVTSFTGQALFGSATTGQIGAIGVGGAINVQSDKNGSLTVGRFSAGRSESLLNSQNADGSSASSIAFAFAGTTKAKVLSDGSYVSGSAQGLTVVKNLTGSGGLACTETFTGGILTASTCP